MNAYSRAERVGGLIRQTISEILLRQVKDPRLELATITVVKMTRDLKIARVYFVVPGGDEKAAAANDGFQSAAGYLKRALSSRLDLRYMPQLEFYYDDSFDYGSNIEKLLNSIRTES